MKRKVKSAASTEVRGSYPFSFCFVEKTKGDSEYG